MAKKILFIILLMLGSHAALAQKTFTAKNGAVFPANEIGISYGGINLPEFAEVVGGALSEALTLGHAKIDRMSCSGCLALEYLRYVTPYIGVGLTATAESFHLKFEGTDDTGNSVMTLFMPSMKASWFRKEHFGMYSKISVGAGIAASHNDADLLFAFQASPVAVEAGNASVRGFAEIGIGCQNLICAGVRYCF